MSREFPVDVPFHEGLFLGSYLSCQMWIEDYYEFLSIIGDDYE